MLNGDKTYDFTIRFGAATATDDAEGEVVAESAVRPTRADVEAVLPRFTGPIRQRPPAYSALKVDGERAYKRARAGEKVELAERQVTISSLTSTPSFPRTRESSACDGGAEQDAAVGMDSRVRGNDETAEEITLSATVSKGTYIRALARDIAEALGTVGHVSMLRRTRCGPFSLENAISVDTLEKAATERGLGSMVLPMTAGLDDIPALSVTPEEASRLKHGQNLSGRPEPDGSYIAVDGTTPVAMVSLISGESRTDRGFNL